MRASSALALPLIAAMSFGQQQSTVAPSSSPENTSAAKLPPKKSVSDPPPKPKPIPPEELWLYPAQRLSASLESDSWRMRRDLHAIGFATLGAAWWKQDRSAGEHWVYPAVDEVAIASQDESEPESNRRLSAARRVLQLVAPLDPILRERIKDVVRVAAERSNEYGPVIRAVTADALMDAAESAGPTQRAAAISDALQYGVTTGVVTAINNLRKNDPEEAERLFDRALSLAMSSRSPEDIRGFSLLVDEDADSYPAQWRQRVANAYVRMLGAGSSLDQNLRCVLAGESGSLGKDAGPEVLQAVAATTAECDSAISDPVLSTDAQVLQRADPKTCDDYLAVAGQSKSPISRYKVKLLAAEKAEKEDTDTDNGGPVRALRVFDAMTSEERAVRPGEYKRLRAEEAIKASLFTLSKSGCSAALRVVDTSPRETILHIAVSVAEKVVSSPPCYRDAMEIVVWQLSRLPTDDPNDYIRLINLVVRHGPYPEQTLQQILRAMDGWKEKDRKTVLAGEAVYEAPWNSLLPLPIVSEIFSLGAERLSAIGRCCYRNDLLRTDFELFLVRGFLDRYARDLVKQKEEQMKAEAEKP